MSFYSWCALVGAICGFLIVLRGNNWPQGMKFPRMARKIFEDLPMLTFFTVIGAIALPSVFFVIKIIIVGLYPLYTKLVFFLNTI